MNTCAAVQLHRVVLVSLPARLTDAVVNGDVDGGVELQRENVGGREWVALLPPAVAPHAAAVDWALQVRRWHVVNTRQQKTLTTEVQAEQESSWM